MSLRLETLGGLRVLLNGSEQPGLTRQYVRCGLLVYLAVERSAPRERVLTLFWPERPPARSRRALSQMLYELRRWLGGEWVTLEGDLVTASPDVSTDAVEFAAAIASGAADAVRLYRGSFLDSIRLADTPEFEAWVDRRRTELRDLFRDAQREVVRRLTAAGDLQGAVAAARRWTLAEPLDEQAQRQLMTLLARSGLRNEALRQFDVHRRRLIDLGTEPTDDLCSLEEEIRSGRLAHETAGALPASAPQLGARAGVVVLPFQDMSPGQAYGHFCDGLAEEIISGLSRVSGLRVVPRTSAFAFRGARIMEAASALGVTHAVEGSARCYDGGYRVTVRLIEAEREAELWHDQLTGTLSSEELFRVQDRIAEAVTHALRSHIGAVATVVTAAGPPRHVRRPTSSTEAYQSYLKGRKAWYMRTPTGLWEGLQHFQDAVEADPDYAQAHAGIADVYCLLGAFDYALLPPGEAYPKAREAAGAALAIDPELGAAHAALGNVQLSHDWDWDAAGSSYRRAIELDPGYSLARQWHSSLLLYRGEDDAALSEAVLALELDPRSAYVSSHLARLLQLLGQPQRAVEQYGHALEIDPRLVTAHLGLALADLTLGRTERSLERLEPLAKQLGDELPLVKALWGYALGVCGRREEARSVCQHLKATPARYLPPEHVAVVYIGLGEPDRAVDWLRRALEARSQVAALLRVEPILDPLRDHLGFRAVLARVTDPRAAP